MRIIKNPNPVEEQIRECDNCGCVFAFTISDIKTFCTDNGIIGSGYYAYRKKSVLCPNCGKELIIEEKRGGAENLCEATIVRLRDTEPDPEDLLIYPHLDEEDDE